MGDLRAGTDGSTVSQPTGKRIARHSAEQVTDQPYVGRRVAQQPGRRRAEPSAVPPVPPSFFSEAPTVGRRALRVDVVPFALSPAAVAPVEPDPEPQVGTAPEVTAPVALAPLVIEPVLAAPAPQPLVVEPVLAAPAPQPLVIEPVAAPAPKPLVGEPVLAAPAPKPLVVEPVVLEAPAQPRVAASRTAPGRRVARRRSPIPLPGAPLLMGVAILAVSAGGALQAMHSDTAAAADAHHLAPASALSGSSAVGTASLLGDRAPSVSRSSDRLQAAADAQAKQRAATLSGYASKAQKQSAKIQLHAWVLPVAAGVYHLTARFGDYSSLWSNFHTGLDFASPTGTPIMAVAGGTISETSYSGAYGNRTIETLPDGTELWYCHQNEFGTTVGATVRPGEVIGYVGSTGNVTGPHLHLEVHPGGGDPVDPYTALEVHGLHP
jgi:murein DD-endopeptidase MepM/ murein hydrolase activator NlpD